MKKWKEASLIYLLAQICLVFVTDANFFGDFGDRIKPKALKSLENENDGLLSSSEGDSSKPSPRESHGLIPTNFKAIKREKLTHLSAEIKKAGAELPVEFDTQESQEESTTAPTTTTVLLSGGNGAHPTPSLFNKRLQRNRARLQTRLTVPPASLKSKNTESELEIDSHDEIPNEQPTWKHLMRSIKPLESHLWLKDNKRKQSAETANEDVPPWNIDKKETISSTSKEEDMFRVKNPVSNCTGSESDYCEDSQVPIATTNQNKRRQFHRSEGHLPINFRRNFKPKSGPTRLRVQPVVDESNDSNSPSEIDERKHPSRQINTSSLEATMIPESAKGERANTHSISGSSTESLTMTPQSTLRDHNTESDLNINKGSPLTAKSIHLDTSSFVTTAGPLASHRLEDWLVSTTDTGWVHPKITTDRSEEQKTFGPFTLPAAPSHQTVTESGLSSDTSSRNGGAKQALKSGVHRQQTITKVSSDDPQVVGFTQVGHPELSEYFHDRKHAPVNQDSPQPDDSTDMHIYKATKDIIEQAQLEERRKAIFSTIRSSPVRHRIVNDNPRVPSARQSDGVSKNTSGTHQALRSQSNHRTRNIGSPSREHHQDFISNTETSIPTKSSNINNDVFIVTQIPEHSIENNNNSTEFVRGYMMERENPFTKISSDEEFQVSQSQSQEIRVSSPALQRKRVVYQNQIVVPGGKLRGLEEPDVQDRPPPTFGPYSDYLKEHRMTDEIFGDANPHSNPQGSFGNLHDRRVSNEVHLDHKFSKEKYSSKDSLAINAHPSFSGENPVGQRQPYPNDQFEKVSHSVVSSTIWGNTDRANPVNLPKDIARIQGQTVVTPIRNAQINKNIQSEPHQSYRFRVPNDNGRQENRHIIDQSTTRIVGNQIKVDNHRPMSQSLPTFSKDQEGKDELVRSSFVYFSPPASVSSNSSIVPPQNEFEKSLRSIFSINHNLPDPIHEASQENHIVANDGNKFRAFSNAPQFPSVNPIRPPTEPSADFTPPGLLHPKTTSTHEIQTFSTSHFPSNNVVFSGTHVANGSPGNHLHVSTPEVHQKESQFVTNNNFHGLINFELLKNKGNSPQNQGGSIANANFQSFNEIGSNIPNLAQNTGNAEPFLSARDHPNIPNFHSEGGSNRHTSTRNQLRDSNEQGSELQHHSREIGKNIPTSFASFEVEQFLGHPDHFPTSSPILDTNENSHNRHRTNNHNKHSHEDQTVNSNESLLLQSHEHQHQHFSEEHRRPHFPPDSREHDDNEDNRRPHFSPDSREPSSNEDNRRPHFPRDSREHEENEDNSRPHFPHDSREHQLNQDNRQPHFVSDSREPELNHDDRKPNFIAVGRPQFIKDNRRPEFPLDNRRPQFRQNTRPQLFSHENRRPNFNPENRRPTLGPGNRRPQLIQDGRRPKFNQNGRPFQGPFSAETLNQLDLENRKRPGIIIAQTPGHRPNFPTLTPANPGFPRPPAETLRPPPNVISNVENSNLIRNPVTSSGDEIQFSESTRGHNVNHVNSELQTTEIQAQNNNLPVLSTGKNTFQLVNQQQNAFGKHQETPVILAPLLIPPPPSSARPLVPPRDLGNALEANPNQGHSSHQLNPSLRIESHRPSPLTPPSPPPPPPTPPQTPNANTHVPHHRLPPPPRHPVLLNQIMSPLRPLLPRPLPQVIRNVRQNVHHIPSNSGHFHRNPTDPSTQLDVEHQNSLQEESVRFPESHEMESDFTPIREVSQPLPEKSSERKIRLSESHAKMLENMRYGVDGKPLDVWIPIVGKEEPDSHKDTADDRRPHLDHSHEDQFDTHNFDEDEFDFNQSHERRFPGRPHHHDDDFDYSNEKENNFKERNDENVDHWNFEITNTTTTTTRQPSSSSNAYKGPRYNVINVPNINIISTVH